MIQTSTGAAYYSIGHSTLISVPFDINTRDYRQSSVIPSSAQQHIQHGLSSGMITHKILTLRLSFIISACLCSPAHLPSPGLLCSTIPSPTLHPGSLLNPLSPNSQWSWLSISSFSLSTRLHLHSPQASHSGQSSCLCFSLSLIHTVPFLGPA